jgi:hypothetical protein
MKPPLENVDWLIILAFPNGGSTAIAKLLMTAEGTVALNSRIEGQWLVPEMSSPRNRWNPRHSLDYEDIRTRWIDAIRRNLRASNAGGSRRVVIEKSPPNMCRYRAIISMLSSMKTDIIVMTRDPYATCAGWHNRYGPEGIDRDWGWPGQPPTDEDSYFHALGKIWIERARYLHSARSDATCWIRYEDFVDHPSVTVGQLAEKIPCLRSVNADANIQVKDYPSQKIRNMNKEQIASLTTNQMAAISSALTEASELVAGFGYDVTPP